jgi:tubulin epsilon
MMQTAKKRPGSSLVDNGSLVKIYDQKKTDAFDTMNNIVANLLLNMTSSMRFEGSMNVDINDIVTNLIPFPSLN